MIFSLPKSLIKTTEKVLHKQKPVAYSWGNLDALNKWLDAMNKKQIDSLLGLNGKVKYPLIWLVEGSKATEIVAGYKFEKVTFWISCNSDVSKLNENRDFSTQYEVANEFIDKLKLVLRIGDDSISWIEKSNVSTNKESPQSDIWDSVILTMDIVILKNCIKKLYDIVKTTGNGGGNETPPEEPECALPDLTSFPHNQFDERIYITKGVTSYLQIVATNNPSSYSIGIPFLTDTEGISVDAQTGLITVNYNGLGDIVMLNYAATNVCGTTSKFVYLKPVDSDVNALLPPIELVADDFNPQGFGPSFMLACTFLPYSGTIIKAEYFKDDLLYKTFEGANLGNYVGFVGNRMQNMAYEGTYDFKIRVMNNLGQYSDFSETLTVTIPSQY